jgi:hypothetical protein
MQGLLAVWNDCDAHRLEDYERWYMREHLSDRVRLDGFEQGVRYEAIDEAQTPRFFTAYDMASPEVIQSPAYQQSLREPSEATRDIMAHFRHMWRSVARLHAKAGQSSGVWILVLRLGLLAGFGGRGHEEPPIADAASWGRLLESEAPERAIRWRVYDNCLKAHANSPEARFRPQADYAPEALVMIEHLRRADLEHSQDEWLMRPEVSAMLSQHQAQVGAYLEMTRMDHRSFRG